MKYRSATSVLAAVFLYASLGTANAQDASAEDKIWFAGITWWQSLAQCAGNSFAAATLNRTRFHDDATASQLEDRAQRLLGHSRNRLIVDRQISEADATRMVDGVAEATRIASEEQDRQFPSSGVAASNCSNTLSAYEAQFGFTDTP